jgi:hypothetical protein
VPATPPAPAPAAAPAAQPEATAAPAAAPALVPAPAGPTTPAAAPAPAPERSATAAPAPAAEKAPAKADPPAKEDPNVRKASCSSCGAGLLGIPGPGPGIVGGCAGGCCGGGQCIPGRFHECGCCSCDGCVGRILCGLYECICCPDPCYEPCWVEAANAAFYADPVRPVTQTRLRYDGLLNLQHLDRAEFLFARFNTTPMQLVFPGTPCVQPNVPGRGVTGIPDRADMHLLSFYTEVAPTPRFSMFVELPYRRDEFHDSGLVTPGPCDKSGLGDMNVGVKTLLLDCDLVQLAFQFRSYLPTGDPGNGLGTGHTALEPSLLFALKLTHDWYVQGQMAYWFSLGGDPNYQGTVWWNDVSLNGVLCRILPGVELVGTFEISDWSFLDGAYTNTNSLVPDPNNGNVLTPFAVRANSTMWAAGPGLRLNICNKIDFGVAMRYWLTSERIASQEYTAEMRWRF